MRSVPPIIPPDALLNIPHLGRLRFVVSNPDTVFVETVDKNQNPKFTGCNHSVEINNVEYRRVRVTVHSAKYWADYVTTRTLGTDPQDTLIWTTDGTWAARGADATGTRVDPANRGRNITASATSKLVKRVMLFLDGYMPTEDAQQMIRDCDMAKRQAQIAHSREEIERLNDLLDAEKKKLAAALDFGVADLIDLRRALQDGDDLEGALYPKDPDA